MSIGLKCAVGPFITIDSAHVFDVLLGGGFEAFIAVGLRRVDELSGSGDGPRAKTFELDARSSGLRARLTNQFYFGSWPVF